MATIKIDRGFTQKIQAKGLVHTPISTPPPPPPKKKGGPPWMKVAVILGAVALVAVIGVAVSSGGKKKKAAQAAPAPKTVAAVQSAQPGRPQDTGAVEPVEPEETRSLYEKPASAAVTAADAPKPPSPPPKPILREITLGAPNGVLCEYYENIPDGQIKSLRAAPTFPGQPTRTVQVGRFELSENVGDQYGVRARAWVTPPKSGAYLFSVCGDDAVELWLSTDDTPANARKIVSFGRWARGWGSRSDQQSEPCALEAGKSYYIEALMKEGTGGDSLAVGWSGPVSEKPVVIGEEFLRPWSDKPATAAAPASGSAEERRKIREAALAPVREAVAEQQRVNGEVYRFAEAAQELKKKQSSWSGSAAAELAETAVLRFELLARLRAFLQEDLAKARLKGVWVVFGGQADVTGASDEGVTVAPGRIVAWGKVPADQMLRLINATVPKASGDGARKGALLLAAAVYCKEVQGGVELAMKYRERALAANAALEASADRLLGGSPEAILAQPRIRLTLGELDQAAAAAGRLSEECEALRQKVEAASAAPQPGLTVEYWDNAVCSSIDDLRNKGITTKRPPDVVAHLADFELPRNRADQYVARIKGFLSPAESGEYLFFIASDDHSELWLSPDENPDKAVLCVKNDVAVGVKQWDKEKRASKPVRLEKGRRYFVKGLLREGSQTDHLEVAWCLASQGEPKLIAGEFLTCLPASGAPAAGSDDGRTKALSELGRAQERLAESLELCGPGGAPSEACGPQAPQVADALQRQLSEAKAKLQEAEALLRAARERAPKE
jgi:hypothetical protein